jgi:hypothetical protein
LRGCLRGDVDCFGQAWVVCAPSLFSLLFADQDINSSGCSTFLKGETPGVHIDTTSQITYQSILFSKMHTAYRSKVILMAETDVHFPMLTVSETLLFAAHARCPSNRFPNLTWDIYTAHIRDVVMALYGLTRATRWLEMENAWRMALVSVYQCSQSPYDVSSLSLFSLFHLLLFPSTLTSLPPTGLRQSNPPLRRPPNLLRPRLLRSPVLHF